MRSGRHLWLAGVGAGALISALATGAHAADVNIVNNSTITGELSATTTGTDKISIINNGAVINSAGPAIVAKADKGAVAVTNNGVVTASQDGILATTNSNDGVSITLNSGLTAGVGQGASATDTTGGAATVTVASGTTKAPMTITAGAGTGTAGVVAVSYFGAATTTIGDHVAIINGGAGVSGDADAAAVAVLTGADGSGPSASVTTGKADSFTLTGNASAAISAHVGIGGSVGPNGSASASAIVGDNVSIHVSGYTDAGVLASTTDTTGAAKFAGKGDATAIVGTGTILVDEVGAVGGPSNSKTSVGVGAFSSGGNVVIDDAAQVTVTGGAETVVGLDASTTGAGASKVTARASITTGSGDGVSSYTVDGVNVVNVLGGTIQATLGHGVDAGSVNGAVMVSTADKSVVGTTTPGYAGIFANSGSGTVSVDAEGAISDGGILTKSGSGAVAVVTGSKTVNNTAGLGISATSGQGAVSVTTGGPITASDQGVLASTFGLGAVKVSIGGSVTSGGAIAVEGISNDAAIGVAPVVVTTVSGTGGRPIAITDPNGSGIEAISVLGAAQATLGDHNVVTVGHSGLVSMAGVDAIAVVTPVDFTGAPSAQTHVGDHDSVVVQGNRGSAITAQTGLGGQLGPSGTASAAVTVGDDVDIHVSGYSDAGVAAFTADFSGAATYSSKGAATVVVGTGSITVDETGASGAPGLSAINYGIAAGSGGGNVLIDSAAVVTVSGGVDASYGLSATTTGGGAATIASSASVSSANGDAIRANTVDGAVNVKVAAGKVTAANGAGIDAIANGAGAVTVVTAAGTSVGSSTPLFDNGIRALSGSGPVTVQAGGVVTDGGIMAQTGGPGAVDVLAAEKVTNTGGDGIDAFGGSGSVLVNVAGPVKASGSGVWGQASGSVTIIDTGSVTAGPTGVYALGAVSTGAGTATVNTANGADTSRIVLRGGLSSGALAYSVGGQAFVQIGDDNTVVSGGPGVVQGAAVSAQSLASSGVDSAHVILGANDIVTFQGNQSAGISAINASFTPLGTGGVVVATGDGLKAHVSGYDSAGVYASNLDTSGRGAYFGAGDVTVTLGTGQITVDETGAVGSTSGSATNIGAGAFSLYGNVRLTSAADVTVSGGVDGTFGLTTYTQGPGATSTITSTGAVVSRQGDGILGRTLDGWNEIDVKGGSVSAPQGAGIDALSTGAATVNVSVSGGATITGLIGVSATSLGSAAVGNNDGSVIKGGAGGAVVLKSPTQAFASNQLGSVITAPGSDTAPTIAMAGSGELFVTNAGTLTSSHTGHDGLVVVAGSGGLNLYNTPTGVFDGRFTAADNASVQNDGVWYTRGVSNFGTTAGGYSNSFVNLGTLQVGQTGPSASTTSFVNVGHFNNGGFGYTGVVSMVNGKEGDVFNISGQFVGAAGQSVLALDAFLGGPGSKADQLRLSSGSAGQTMIRINDTNTGDGALNAKGIVLVQGATAAGDFILDPSQPGYDPTLHGIQHGLFVYPLTFAGGNEELIGVPGLPAAQFATMASAAEQVWSSTSPGADAADSLRLSLSGSGEAPRVWGKALNWGASRLAAGQLSLGAEGALNSLQAGGDRPMSGSVSQSASVNAFGQTYGFNTSYSQSTSALVAGFDLGRRVGQDSAWSWGLSTGYVESQQSFAQGASAALYDGAMVAAHGAYVTRGGFYLSGDVKMTALKVTYLTAWAGMGRQTGNITTFGGEAQAGWRRSLSGTWTVEPQASLAVQSSRLGTLVVSDTPLNFGQASSARVSVGARLEGGWKIGGWAIKSSTSLTGVDELQDANTLRLQTIDTGYVLPDQIGGAFADLGQSVSFDRADGRVSAFFSGAYRVKPGYQAAQAAVGLKLRW